MKTKKTTLILSFVMIACLVTGCAFGGFDASGYVKACLDSNVHGEFDDYAKITNSSVDDVKALYDNFLESDLSFLDAYNADDSKKQQFRDLFVKLYKNFKYEVGEATKNGDDYTVPVTVYKLIVFRDVAANMEDDMTAYVNEQTSAGVTPSVDEIYAYVLDYMYNELSRELDELEYAEPQTITVNVKKDASSNAYMIDQNELQSLVEAMVDMENAQS